MISKLKDRLAASKKLQTPKSYMKLMRLFFLILSAGVVIYSLLDIKNIGQDVMTNMIVELLGVCLTYFMFDVYISKLQENDREMPGKYLHYAKLLKCTKRWLCEASEVQEILATGKPSRSKAQSLRNAKKQFEATVYDAASYLEKKEFELLWPLLYDEKLDIDSTIATLGELGHWLEQDIRSHINYEDAEV